MSPDLVQSPSFRVYSDDALSTLPLGDLFGNDRPVDVDLGCGKGRFLLARAADHPDANFLGIDRMLRRIRKVDRKVQRAGLQNVRLFRMEAYYSVTHLIAPQSIRTYFILFPDPWPKHKHLDQRLFNPKFIESLHRTLISGGHVHVATDHAPYFKDMMKVMWAATSFFKPAPTWEPQEHERTDFELLYIDNKPIGRASFVKVD